MAPGLATLAALAILLALGFWQLDRRTWKEDLIGRIEARASAPPGEIAPAASWPTWRADQDEFRRVHVSGIFLHEHEAPVYGLAPGEFGAPIQGYYLFTPLRLPSGAIVMVNRGFVPNESQPKDPVTVTGLVRAPEAKGWFIPDDVPSENRWFTRDPQAIAAAKGLANVAPFYLEADGTPNPGGWPRGGQTRLTMPNNHLQYALTWFGIALTLVGVFATFAWRRLQA
jgi:surfeit locus 1 family protein